MGKETVEVTRCDRCNTVIHEVSSTDTIKLFRSKEINLLDIFVRCWERHDRYYLCNECLKKFREEFLKNGRS